MLWLQVPLQILQEMSEIRILLGSQLGPCLLSLNIDLQVPLGNL